MFRALFKCVQVGISCFAHGVPEYPACSSAVIPEEYRSPRGPGSSKPTDNLIPIKENEDQADELSIESTPPEEYICQTNIGV